MTPTGRAAPPDDLANERAGDMVRIDVGNAAPEALPGWNLADLYAGTDDPAIEADFGSLDREGSRFAADYRGKVALLAAEALADGCARYELIEQGLGRLHAFAQLCYSADTVAAGTGQFYQTVTERANRSGTHLLFFPLEINRIEAERFETLIADPALAHYRPWLIEVRALREHQLDDQIERLFHEKDVTGHSAWSRLFDETIAGLRVVIGDEEMTMTAALNRLSSADRWMREAAGRAVGSVLSRHDRLFTLITNTVAKDKAIEDEWRGYASPAAARHQANRLEPAVVDALESAVTGSYGRLAHRYYTMKARWLGLERLEHWDRNAPLPGESEALIGWDEARARVLGAYHEFSPEMAVIGQRFFDRDWIDAAPRSGKASGAFAHPTVPSAHPYILLNYHGRTRDVMTLAHELGHGVHQVLAGGQGYLMAQTPLTLAETASVFGEMLTFRAVLAGETDPVRRRLMLAHKVEDMLNTVVRQIAFHQFETRLHQRRQAGELLSEDIGAIWMDVQRESLGPAFHLSDDYRILWAYVPHFIHSPFYVYAYAFGDCLVNALYGVYQDEVRAGKSEDFVQRYLAMLRAGGTMRHRELLEPFGLDAGVPEFWQRGLDVIAGFIDELED